jgi:threonine/homoserine/homoserine lactone efflux protein
MNQTNFYLSLILFCIATSITPGPNNLMVMMSGLNFGIKKSLPHYGGICIGFIIMLLTIGLGLGETLTAFPRLEKVIKVFGMGYLFYLAIQNIFVITTINLNTKRRPLKFYQAVLFQWVNPKAWIMIMGAVANFSRTTHNTYIINIIVIAIIYSLTIVPCIGLWLIGGNLLKNLLKNARQLRLVNISMGLLLIASLLLSF